MRVGIDQAGQHQAIRGVKVLAGRATGKCQIPFSSQGNDTPI